MAESNEKKVLNVYQKLSQARVELQNKKLKKTGKNAYSGFDYFELSDFLPSINEIFNSLGLCSYVDFTNESASLTIINVDNLEEKIVFNSEVVEVTLKGCTPIQNYGAERSYITRYLWLSAMQIVENDIVDRVSSEKTVEQKSYKPKPKQVPTTQQAPTPQQVPTTQQAPIPQEAPSISRNDMLDFIYKCGATDDRIAKTFKVNSIEEVTDNMLQALVSKLRESGK